MSRIMVVLLGIAALTARPIDASAQTDTTRRRDTTRTPTQDTTRRVQLEARGETDLGRSSVRFGVGRANYGFSSGQALELQQPVAHPLQFFAGSRRSELDRLDRYRTANIRVDRMVHDAHRAASQFPNDLVPADAVHSF